MQYVLAESDDLDSNHAVSSFLNTSTLGSGPSYKVESEVDAPKSEKHSYEGK